MFNRSKWQKIATALSACLIAGVMILTLSGCGDRFFKTTPKLNPLQPDSRNSSAVEHAGNISEVSPPAAIQQLHQALEDRQPQIAILTPQTDEILQDNTVNVRFQVQDLPIFKNPDFNLGPHLNVIVDNEPYINVYDLNAPLVLSDLAPGTHTLRVFAVYPWEESFKNEGAYAQTTFHIFAKNQSNAPAPEKPLLTYNTPQGSYGTQPILLDFFLSNAPLHLIARENQQDDIADWRIRCTVNGESFIIDRWQPLYLQGFLPGKNWVQLEFLDEQGNSVSNVFNNTIRVVTYEATTEDPLSRLIGGQLSATQARGIVDPNALQVDTTPDVRSEPEQSPPVESTQSDRSSAQQQSDFVPEPDESLNRLEEPQTPDDGDETPSTQPIPEEIEVPAAQTVPESEVEPTLQPDALEPEQPPYLQKPKGGYFNRRRTTIQPPVLPTPEIVEPSSPEQSEPENMTPAVPIQETPEANLDTAPQEIIPADG